MANSNTTIELNGRTYDARTGKIISEKSVENAGPILEETAEAAQHTEDKIAATLDSRKIPDTVKPKSSGQFVDGFIGKPNKLKKTHISWAKAGPPVAAPAAQPEESKSYASAVRKIKKAGRTPEKSHTLMRPAVKKPTAIKSDISPLKQVRKPDQVSSTRISRAESVLTSPLISKFGHIASQLVTKADAHLPVVPTPKETSRKAAAELEKFEQSIKNATTHLYELEQEAVRKVHFLEKFGFKNKFANITTMSLAVLLLFGFFAYQNSTQISLRLAAERSGVAASMPGYKPAGYSASKNVDTSDGKISVSFKSRTDQTKSFNLTQSASNWNSTTLLANHVTKQACSSCYQTYSSEGKTIYIYNGSNASWVNGGVWYQVGGNAELTSDQLLRLANSM